MKLSICDDEKTMRDWIAEYVQEVSADVEIEFFENADGLINSEPDADIFILDIQMPGINGMEVAKIIRSRGSKAIIIFVTALEEYVFDAFDVHAFQYIVKPINKEKLKIVIERSIAQANESDRINRALLHEKEELRSITVKSDGKNINVSLSEIVYAEVFNRTIVLHLHGGGRIDYYGKLNELEKTVGNDFFRVHRAYIINLFYIKTYDSKNVNVAGENIPIARGKYQELIKAYLSYTTRRLCL